MTEQRSYLEVLFDKVLSIIHKNRIPLLTSLSVGLLTYLFCFVHKLETMDDLANLLTVGSTISSGRWGLELISRIFPSASIPWLNGMVSLLILCAVICILIRMFEVQSVLLRAALAGILVSFPSQTCTFGYMFTTIQYACALLMAVLAAYLLSKSLNRKQILLAGVLLVLSLSIYQAYISVTMSMLIVYCFMLCISGEKSGKDILRKGFVFIAVLLGALLAYYGILAIAKLLSGEELNGYADRNLNGLSGMLYGIRTAYTAFAGCFLRGYYDLVGTPASRIAHFIMILVCSYLVMSHFKEAGNRSEGKFAVAMICIAILPLGVNFIRVISSLFHNLMLFGFTSVYLMCAVVIERCMPDGKTALRNLLKDTISLAMIVVMAINIYFANGVYIKLYFQLEQAKAFYSSVISNLIRDPDFNDELGLCFVGSNDLFCAYPVVSTENQAGIRDGLIGTYSQKQLVKYFLGLDLRFADDDMHEYFSQLEEVRQMPSYPYYGCMKKIDKYMIIKLGESD